MRRMFIGVPVRPDAIPQAGDLLNELARIFSEAAINFRPTRVANLHLTLAFLGNVEDELIPELCKVVKQSAKTEPFELKLAGFGTFSNQGRARVLWLGLEHSQILVELQKSVIRHLGPLHQQSSNGTFVPHLTLGRFSKPCDIKDMMDQSTPPQGRFLVDQLVLFESVTAAGFPRYEPVFDVALGNE